MCARGSMFPDQTPVQRETPLPGEPHGDRVQEARRGHEQLRARRQRQSPARVRLRRPWQPRGHRDVSPG